MKRVLIIFFLFMSAFTQAQFNESTINLKLGTGYAQDFPGLGGYGILGEVSLPMAERFEGAIGLKRFSMQGHPRNASTQEYTRATTIDFNIYFLPLNSETHIVRVGAGYSFSFYNIRRSYPVATGTDKSFTYPTVDTKSKTSGMTVIGEYEYLLANSNISLGLRAAWYKAYDRVGYIGPFVGIRL